MVSNRQYVPVMPRELEPEKALEGSENEPLLESVEAGEAQLQEVIVEPARESYVHIQNQRIPSDALLLIAAHLNLQDYIALSQVNYAIRCTLTSSRITDSLYVRMPGVAGEYTMSAIQRMLHLPFPEMTKQKRLTSLVSCYGKLNDLCHARTAQNVAACSSAVFTIGVIAGVSIPLEGYLLDEGFNALPAIGITLGAAVPSAAISFGLCWSACVIALKITSRCNDYVKDKAAAHDEYMLSDSVINDKVAIFGLFKRSDPDYAQLTIYHQSNQSLEVPPVLRMRPMRGAE